MEVMEIENQYLIRLDRKKPNFGDQLRVVKDLPGRRFCERRQLWHIPKTGFASLEGLIESLKNDLYRVGLAKAKTLAIEGLPELTIDIPLKRELYPFQKQGAAYCLQNKKVLIGDQQGLGKTAQSIAAAVGEGKFPGLIICKSSLKLNWEKEWNDWTDKKVLVFSDSVRHNWPHLFNSGMYDVGIVNYESLQKYFVQKIDTLQPKEPLMVKHIHFWQWINLFKFIVVDESHYVKDTKTKRTKFVAGICRGKEQVYLLSGTPALNDPIELYTQLCILGKNHLFGKKAVFQATYCGKNNKGNLRQLNLLLTRNCYYRRTKAEVLTDLPAKTRQIILCDITNREEYDKAENDFRQYLETQLALTGGQVDKSMRAEAMVKLNMLKRIAARGKIQAIKEYVESLVESGEKVVLFAWHKEIQGELSKLHPKAVRLGDLPTDQKQANKIAFQQEPDVPIIVCSILADAEGHTLTAASNLGLAEMPWHFGKAEQCEDRIHRIGQKGAVNIAYFLAEGTIDLKLYDLIMDKKVMHDGLTGTNDAVEEKTMDKMINLFTKK